MDVAASCSTLTFTAGAPNTATNVTISGTNSLTVTTVLTINGQGGTTAGTTNTFAVGAGTLSAGSVVLAGVSNSGSKFAQITISTGIVSVTGNITSDGTECRITFSGAGTLNAGGTFLSGTAGTFTASTGTVNFNGAAQAIAPFAYTFNNVRLSGSGVKTTTNATINGILSMEGTATASAAPTYGAAATLQYNTTTARTAGAEWITPFAPTGGVIIANTGTITMNAAKVFNASVPLTINSGSSLAMSTFLLTLNGNLVNNGGTTSGSGGVTIAGTATTQSIGSFTTTGTVSCTKTAGTATFTGNVNGGALTINGTGGTLNLGTGLTHTFTGTFTRTNGTLNCGSSILNIGGSVSGTGGTFTAGTSTVNWNAAGAQTIAGVDIQQSYPLRLRCKDNNRCHG